MWPLFFPSFRPSLQGMLILVCMTLTYQSVLLSSGSGSDPATERDHGDPESSHETAVGAASQGGQAGEGETETAHAGCGE